MSAPCLTFDRIQKYLRDELPSGEADAIVAHLGSCATCEEAHRKLVRGMVSLRGAGERTRTDRRSRRDEIPTINGYKLSDEAPKEGGMGRVFKAISIEDGRTVAIKVLLPKWVDTAAQKRFRLEGATTIRIGHPNVVAVREIRETEKGAHFVMEWLDGGTLADKLKTSAFTATEAVNHICDFAQGIEAAHALGIWHRDLKPSNLMYDGDGVPKVTDFGLAKVGESGGLTNPGAIVGSKAYMSPEQIIGARTVGPGADIWALGVILYQCVSGRHPFNVDNEGNYYTAIMSSSPLPLQTREGQGASRNLETIVLKCLEKQPEYRYLKASELVQDLKRWLNGQPIYARRPGPFGKAARWVSREPKLTIIAALVMGLLVVGAAWLETKGERNTANEALAKSVESDNRARLANQELAQKNEMLDRVGYGKITQTTFLMLSSHRSSSANFRSTPPAFRGWEWLWLDATSRFQTLDVPTTAYGVGGRDLPNGDRANLHVGSLAFSPDRSRLVEASGDARIFDLVSGREMHVLRGGGIINSVAFSPDGKWIATADTDGRLEIWDVETGKSLLVLRGDGLARKEEPRAGEAGTGALVAAFRVSGTQVLAVIQGDVYIWNLHISESGAIVAALARKIENHQNQIVHASFSPDGKLIVTAGKKHTGVYESLTGKLIRSISGESQLAVISPDGKHVAVVHVWDAAIYNIEDGAKCHWLSRHTECIYSISYSPDGNRLLTGGDDQSICIWDANWGVDLLILRGGSMATFSNDGAAIATSYPDGSICIYDTIPRKTKGTALRRPNWRN